MTILRGSKAPSSEQVASMRKTGAIELARVLDHFRLTPCEIADAYQVDRSEMTRLRAGSRTLPVRCATIHRVFCKLAGFTSELY